MLHSIRTHPVRWSVAGVGVLAALAWLAFGFFGVHTLFIDDVVSEAAPVFDVPAEQPAAQPTDLPAAAPTQPSGAQEPAQPPTDTTPAADAPEPANDDAEPLAAAAPETTQAPTTEPAEPQIVTEATGTFTSDAHPTSGTAVVLGNGTGQRFLRFENFATDNGPDLNVYLVNSASGAGDFIDLGDLKGNIGEQNYEIPEGVDLSVYDTVYVWCVRFGVSFGNAVLS
jgi:hypothetical protein